MLLFQRHRRRDRSHERRLLECRFDTTVLIGGMAVMAVPLATFVFAIQHLDLLKMFASPFPTLSPDVVTVIFHAVVGVVQFDHLG